MTWPCGEFEYEFGDFEYSRNGVFFKVERTVKDDDGGEQIEADLTEICGPLVIVAASRSLSQQGWGRLLRWMDMDGHVHEKAFPQVMLQGDGRQIREVLSASGLVIGTSSKKRALFLAFIVHFPTSERIWCTQTLGWHKDTFVLNGRCIGSDTVIYQGPVGLLGLSTKGTLADWKMQISQMCEGNSRLILSLSLSFLGPLLSRVGHESFGVHFFGRSSIGKSTAAAISSSVYGDQSFIRNWRTTSNGLEGVAGAHNHLILVLDEMGQADVKQIAVAAYQLANGLGKARADIAGSAREIATWRLVFFSTGELTLGEMKSRHGLPINVGEEVRLIDVPADADLGMGIFEQTHELLPSELAHHLSQSVRTAHGTAGEAWITELVENPSISSLAIELAAGYMHLFSKDDLPTSAHERVARHFCFIAAAGELATQSNITGWRQGSALQSAMVCFQAWRQSFGSGVRENEKIVREVSGFLLAHGSSRFERLPGDGTERVLNRAGYVKRDQDNSYRYLIFDDQLRSIAGCNDIGVVRKALLDAGMLVPGGDGRLDRKERIPGARNPGRINVIRYA